VTIPDIQTILSAGTYYLGLSVLDNFPLTGTLADGYTQTGNPGFTCAEGGLSGQFCDVSDALFATRTGNWAFTLDVAPAPEPAGIPVVLPVFLLAAARLRRRFPI
jgi:hypothetical protein